MLFWKLRSPCWCGDGLSETRKEVLCYKTKVKRPKYFAASKYVVVLVSEMF